MSWTDKVVLITGGTGALGRALASLLLREGCPRRLVIFSRDELKHEAMRRGGFDHPALQYVLGDVRDAERVRAALRGVDVVVHAAALKQVPACEQNPAEAVLTNVNGTHNVVEAALERAVPHVLAVSTDKAVHPVGLYGATKLVAEKLVVRAALANRSRFGVIRYGNIAGSPGSAIPAFLAQRATGTITITDPHMTRFWTSAGRAARAALRFLDRMEGGEVYIPKMPSLRLVDLVGALAPGCRMEVAGARPGEKRHETLVSEDEAERTRDLEDAYVIAPPRADRTPGGWADGRPVPERFRYASDTNDWWLRGPELTALLQEAGATPSRSPAAP